MAEFPITRAPERLPISGATGVRANIDVRTGEGAVGAAIGQAGLAVAGELQKASVRKDAIRARNRKNLDDLSRRQADKLDELTAAENLTMKTDAPPEKWEEETVKIVTKNNNRKFALDFSSEALNEQQILAKLDLEVLPAESFAAGSRVISAATIKSGEEKLTDAHRSSKDIAQTELDTVAMWKRNGVSAPDILLRIKAAKEAGEKLRSEDAVSAKENEASRLGGPEKVIAEMKLEKKLRKEGKGSPDNAALKDKDLESIIDYANTIGDKQKTQSELNREAATVDAYSQIRNGAADIGALVDENNLDPLQSNEDKTLFAEKILTYFKQINSTKEAEQSDEDVYDELTQATELVERGALSPVVFEDLYAANKEFLTGADQRKIRSKDIVATKTMQNRTFADAMTTERATFIEVTADDITAILLARDAAELTQDIPAINSFNIAIKKNQAERWNFGRYRNQLREQINQNPDWSTKQINTQKDILIEQLDIPFDELIRAFDGMNSNQAITKTSPDVAFNDIWADLSFEAKSLIWAGRMKGIPANVLLLGEEVTKTRKAKK